MKLGVESMKCLKPVKKNRKESSQKGSFSGF